MSLSSQITSLASRVAAEFKMVRGRVQQDSDDSLGKMVAFGFENSEMTARGYSVTAASFVPLPGAEPVANSNALYGFRDPSIARYDGFYYMVGTRPLKSAYLGTGATVMQIHRSTNLVDWEQIADIPVGVTSATRAWAPEIFVDGADVYVYYAVTTNTTENAALITNFDIYARKASNAVLTTWGTATKMLGLVTPKVIDAQLTRVDDARGRYVMFYKDETAMRICRAWSDSPMGPWTTDRTGNWLTSESTEGPQLMRLPGGRWRLYYDRYAANRLGFKESADLDTWSAETSLTYAPAYLRHPGYLWLDQAEWSQLTNRVRSVRAYNSPVQPIPNNAMTAISLQFSQGDTGMWASGTPTRLIAGSSGWYDLNASLAWASNPTGQRSAAFRFSNGAVMQYRGSQPATAGGMGTEQSFTDHFYLAAGEYVEIMGLQTSGGNLNVSAVASLKRVR